MTTESLHEVLQGRLKAEKKRLVDQLEQVRARRESGDRLEGSPFGKREEEASETTELESLIAFEGNISEQLVGVERALEKFDKGTYGLCEKCGRPIEAARLEALPDATLCLSCKTAQAKDARIR